MSWFGNSNNSEQKANNSEQKEKLEEAKRLVELSGTNNIKKAIQIYRKYEHGLGNIVQVLEDRIGVGPFSVAEKAAKQHEKLLEFDEAAEVYKRLEMDDDVIRVRKLKAEQGAVKVDQTVVQGDQITKTEIKDSILNRSNVGGGSSKCRN